MAVLVKDLRQYITDKLAGQWKEIGRQLALPPNTLAMIEHDHVEPKFCCDEMLKKWSKRQQSVNSEAEVNPSATHARELINTIAEECSDSVDRADRMSSGNLTIEFNYGCTIYAFPLLCNFTSKVQDFAQEQGN